MWQHVKCAHIWLCSEAVNHELQRLIYIILLWKQTQSADTCARLWANIIDHKLVNFKITEFTTVCSCEKILSENKYFTSTIDQTSFSLYNSLLVTWKCNFMGQCLFIPTCKWLSKCLTYAASLISAENTHHLQRSWLFLALFCILDIGNAYR